MNQINVLGLKFINSDILESVEHGMRLIEARESACIVAPNTELLQAGRKSKKLMSALKSAELVLPEGNGIIMASKILGMPLSHRISADDFTSALLARMSEKEMSVFIAGAEHELAEAAEESIKERYPGLKIAGCDDGLYSSEIELISAINQSRPDLLLVCYGSPKQELWMKRNRENLKCGAMIAYGEGIKLLAGQKKRAPKRWRDSGFEWFYWILKEPGIIPRMIKRSGLIFTAIWRRLAG